MKLVEALEIAGRNPSPTAAETLRVALVCGFTPLHLQTFLHAELLLRYPDRHVEIATGLYDDIPGTLRRIDAEPWDAVVLVLEWGDIDARLGLRRLGGWSPRQLDALSEHAQAWLGHVRALVETVASTSPTVVVPPTLPLPPLFVTGRWQTSLDELRLRHCLVGFAAAVARCPRVRVVAEQAMDLSSPPAERLSVKSLWSSGFPYRTEHAARVAELVALAIENPLPKKGLITDLDDTLWAGIAGEDGPQGLSWDLDHRTQAHGLYQQFLSTLADEGVLIGVASKNDPAVVEEAFARDDILIPKDKVFPLAVGWGSKARGVSQVLSAWNVSAESVIFVDDSPLEIAEVKAAHPAIECVQFPRHDPQAVYDTIARLRDRFGRSIVSHEDTIRLQSLRSAATLGPPAGSEGYSEALLREARGVLTLTFGRDSRDARALELVNKTNQFNLNGRRFTERAWLEYLQAPGRFLLTASYTDRFGTLGKIAVVAGRAAHSTVCVDVWVMSCRAFARRIEHHCLKAVFERYRVGAIDFDYSTTPRNGPMTSFLDELLGRTPASPSTVTREAFATRSPALFHELTVKDELGDERYAGSAR